MSKMHFLFGSGGHAIYCILLLLDKLGLFILGYIYSSYTLFSPSMHESQIKTILQEHELGMYFLKQYGY